MMTVGERGVCVCVCVYIYIYVYRGTEKSLARPTSRCILFAGENISFDASLVIYMHIYIYIVVIFLQLWL
jgi:hypothetical protein